MTPTAAMLDAGSRVLFENVGEAFEPRWQERIGAMFAAMVQAAEPATAEIGIPITEQDQTLAGLTVTLVETAPHLPAAGTMSIRKWDNHGLPAGTHRLFAVPAVPDRETLARIVAASLQAQEEREPVAPEDVVFADGLSWTYIDQNAADFGLIADDLLAALYSQGFGQMLAAALAAAGREGAGE